MDWIESFPNKSAIVHASFNTGDIRVPINCSSPIAARTRLFPASTNLQKRPRFCHAHVGVTDNIRALEMQFAAVLASLAYTL